MNKYTQTTFSNNGCNEIAITKGRELAAHTSFCYVKQNSEVVITDLFVSESYRDTAFMDVLMAEIEHFAAQQQARTIKVFCGNEPMCADGQIPLEDEVEWYQSHGFEVQGYVYDIVPILIKTL